VKVNINVKYSIVIHISCEKNTYVFIRYLYLYVSDFIKDIVYIVKLLISVSNYFNQDITAFCKPKIRYVHFHTTYISNIEWFILWLGSLNVFMTQLLNYYK